MNLKKDRRLKPDTLAILILIILAFPMAIPTSRKFFGHNSGFLRDLGFLSGPDGTITAWILAILITLTYIGLPCLMYRQFRARGSNWIGENWLCSLQLLLWKRQSFAVSSWT